LIADAAIRGVIRLRDFGLSTTPRIGVDYARPIVGKEVSLRDEQEQSADVRVACN
jgi:hypothetical protein